MTRYLIILLLASTLFGCSICATQHFSISSQNVNAGNKANDNEANVKDYFPLEIGNKWVYTLETYGEKRPDNVFIVTGKEKFDGVECIKVEQSEEIDGKLEPEYISFYTKDEKGVYLHRWGDITKETKKIWWIEVYKPPLMILSYPLKNLKRWEWRDKKAVRNPDKGKIFTFDVVGEEEVEIPAGKFKAYIVKRELNMYFPFWEIYAYSPDVGLVAHRILNRSTFILKSFTKSGNSKREVEK